MYAPWMTQEDRAGICDHICGRGSTEQQGEDED